MLYAFGSNGSGQLGIGHLDDVNQPRIFHRPSSTTDKSSAEPVSICAGGNHTLVLFASGDLYVVGATRSHFSDGTLGADALAPRFLAEGVTLCAATWEASIFTTHGGTRLFTCGQGPKGELGCGTETVNISVAKATPVLVPGLGENGLHVVALASGMQHTVAVLSDGTVYGWGQGRKGQLGEPNGVVWAPRRVAGVDFKAVRAACGREFTYLVGAREEGSHAILGSDKWSVKHNAPRAVPNWLQVGACWGSLLVLFQDGSIKSWGRDDHGQLAPDNLPAVTNLAAGSEHSVAITRDKKIIAWGWGEHGNCGPRTDENGDVMHTWAEISLPGDIRGVPVGCGAGCATSWVWA
jgi:protein ATS1